MNDSDFRMLQDPARALLVRLLCAYSFTSINHLSMVANAGLSQMVPGSTPILTAFARQAKTLPCQHMWHGRIRHAEQCARTGNRCRWPRFLSGLWIRVIYSKPYLAEHLRRDNVHLVQQQQAPLPAGNLLHHLAPRCVVKWQASTLILHDYCVRSQRQHPALPMHVLHRLASRYAADATCNDVASAVPEANKTSTAARTR